MRARERGEASRQVDKGGRFSPRAAQEGRNDYTVDWVHLTLNDQAQRTVLCKDPFVSSDDRVDRLIASMRG